MGRPARLTKKWEPKTWKPEYTRVVGYSFLGLSNEMVAEKTGLGKQQVSNILNTMQGHMLMADLQKKQLASLEQSIPEALDAISKKAVERIKTLIDDDIYFEKSPFAVVDRSIAVLKGIGHIKDSDAARGGTTNNFNFNLPPEQSAVLLDGLSKSQEARRLHKGGRDVTDVAENEKKSA